MIWDDEELLEHLQGRAGVFELVDGLDVDASTDNFKYLIIKRRGRNEAKKKPETDQRKVWTDERRKSFGEARRQRNENSDAHSRLIGAISDAVFFQRAKKRAASKAK